MIKKIITTLCILGALSFATSSHAAKGDFRVSFDPILLVAGAINLSGDYAFTENITAGAGYYNWSVDVGSIALDVTETHVRGDYWFSGAYNQGWYAGAIYSKITMTLDETLLGTSYSGEFDATGILAVGGYHWQWASFGMDLGLTAGTYSFDNDLTLTASDGSTTTESAPSAVSGMGIEYNLTWKF